jgi:hypothetical protein
MAAGNVTIYSAAALEIGQGFFSFGTDNYNVILATTSYTPAPNSDTTYANVSGVEVATGGGYTAGTGVSLGGVLWTTSGATSTFAAQSAQWTGASFSARYAIIVRRAGVSLAASDKLLCFVDLTGGGNATATSGTFQINWNNASTPSSANTIFTTTHSP